ncbi:TonB-dependent receptor plug domain-containing protein [Caballeronia sp. LjRoot31]|uniref:TonB-dependent receptor plug domain-containing protein n=1 Tax=Caballeronia sp. LjRoot31 TaxID=3342324 RepID=UPI003ECD64D6
MHGRRSARLGCGPIAGWRRKTISLAVATYACSGAAYAQSEAGPSVAQPASTAQQSREQDGVQVQDRVVVTGTRTATKASKSLTPVNVITAEQLQSTGQTDLRDALVSLSPAIQRQAMGGAQAALVDVLTLHGLTPDQVLVLVNGKRRHSTATISLNPGPQQGSTGVDIDLIPVSAVDHVEILRDGAAAQYGSDAIAGVINIILKSDTKGGSIETSTGQTYQGDGLHQDESAHYGLALGPGGFLDLSAEVSHENHTDRTSQYAHTGALAGSVSNIYFGDPASTREVVGFNAGYYLGDNVELYGFGTYAHKDAASYQSIRGSGVLPAVYPGGFIPQDLLNENDFSVTAGAKGDNLLGWKWDLSTTYGGDYAHFSQATSENLGLYQATGQTPTNFYIGNQQNTEWTNNLDFTRPFNVPLLPAPVTVSFGFEQRTEGYSVGAGEPDAYLYGGTPALVGLTAASASNNTRDVLATYIDLATKITQQWQVDLAGRFEHYSDVGDTTNGKISTRYDFTPWLALRGSVGTGFRAPTLAEEYYTTISPTPTSAFALLAANSAAARSLGAQPLKPEKSTSYNLGLVLTPTRDINVTVDAYEIDIRNRIVEGGSQAGQAAINAIGLAGFSTPLGIPASAISASYFTNGANTRTDGVDLAATYHTYIGQYGTIDWDVGVNFNNTSLTHLAAGANGQPLLNAKQIDYLTSGTPKSKIIIGGIWNWGKWGVSLHETRFGTTSAEESYSTGPNAGSVSVFIPFKNKVEYTTDLETRFEVTKHFEVAVGAKNLFNEYPNKLPLAAQYAGADIDPTTSAIGMDGGFYYLRAKYLF